MTHPLRLAATALAASVLLAVTGCGGKPTPAPSAAPTRPSTAPSTGPAPAASAAPTGAATPGAPDVSATALPQARVIDVKVTEVGGSIQVDGTLIDAQGRPIVGAVGDFFIEGSSQNLVQSYATRVDGRFSSAFTTRELPPEATLMMHYRGDSSTAPGSFLLRRGTPRPATQAPAGTATPSTPPPATQPPAATPRPVALTGLDGEGRPALTLAGARAHVEGRLITAADGHPVRGAALTWRAGSASGQAQTAADGAFAFDADLPPGTRELTLAFAGTADRAPTSVTLPVA